MTRRTFCKTKDVVAEGASPMMTYIFIENQSPMLIASV
jgi:hypothetical protein